MHERPANVRTSCAWLAAACLLGVVLPARDASAQDCCGLSVDDAFRLECNPDTDVARVWWGRACLRYAFARGTIAALVASSQDVPVAEDERLSEARVRSVVERAFSTWQGVVCGDGRAAGFYFEQLAGELDVDEAEFDPDRESEIVVRSRSEQDWAELGYESDAFAQTTLFLDRNTGEVYGVDVEINLARGPYGDCERPCGAGATDLGNTLTHEVGHLLGLAHVPVVNSTLFADALAGEVDKRTLLASDARCLCETYAARGLEHHGCEGQAKGECSCGAPPPLYGQAAAPVTTEPGAPAGCSTVHPRPLGRGLPGWLLVLAALARAGRGERSR